MYTKSNVYIFGFLVYLMLAIPALSDGFSVNNARSFSFESIIVGFGQQDYFQEPAALALDTRSGLIYVADKKDDSVDVFTLQGVPKKQLERERQIKSPIGLAVDKDGNLYVSGSEVGPIKAINPKGDVTDIEIPTVDGDKPVKPGRMATDRDGNLYVVDSANNRVIVLDKGRKVKLRIGSTGDKRGQFRSLQDITVDRQGRLFALDSVGTPVQVFDKKGKYLYRFGFRGDGIEDISVAAALFVDRNDQIWILDKGQHALKVFDQSGEYLRRFGTYGMDQGMLTDPVDAEMDEFGRVYILETLTRRLQIFSLSRPFEPFAPPSGL